MIYYELNMSFFCYHFMQNHVDYNMTHPVRFSWLHNAQLGKMIKLSHEES